jgi:16S rRNA (guanine966-N2)-methyltransferase
LRIITGKYKGRKLFTVDGRTTRPTTAFNREVIFSIQQDYQDMRVLDLYAGTGSFGLEALSRGAEWVDFVEFAPAAIGTLLKNISLMGCGEFCHVWRKRVEVFLKDTESDWDLIFLDPPYNKNLVNSTLELIWKRNLLRSDGIVIIEHSPREILLPGYLEKVVKTRSGKTSSFTLLA